MAENVAEGPSHVTRDSKGQGCAVLAVVVVLAFVIQPVVVVAVLLGMLGFEMRKVRISRWLASAAAIGIVGIIAAGFNPATWLGWLLARPSLAFVPKGVRGFIFDQFPAVMELNQAGIVQAMLAGVPLGFVIVAGYAFWRKYELEQRGKMEGEEYSHRRPVGIVDKLTTRFNRDRLTSGQWADKHPNEIAIGLGKYGQVASMELDQTKKTTVIVGTSQSGKTRLANSIADQLSLKTGGGNITLDFKNDDQMARRKAQLAKEMGVPFLHFQLSNKSGAHYAQPHPYAPDSPAHYDPLQKGNGASKSAMLLNSVPREGDAAAYLRSAREYVMLAYDIADLTGVSARRHQDGTPLSGLEVLKDMLDPDTLFAEGRKITASRIMRANPALSESEAQRRASAITSRLGQVEGELKRANSVLASAVGDTRSLISRYVNDSAMGNWLNVGSTSVNQIDILRAIINNEVVLFSLPTQDYPDVAAMVGTMVLLDISNAVSTLRDNINLIGQHYDSTTSSMPWNPINLQIEEVGSIKSDAAAEAMLGLLNKSADMEIRVTLSTQSLVDMEAVDGTGIWKNQILAQAGNLMSLQITAAKDDQDICDFSTKVTKQLASENRAVENNRFRLGLGASASASVRSNPVETTKIAPGVAKGLVRKDRQMVWIDTAASTAVHTLDEEGPNQWWEVLEMVALHEPERDWKPFDSDEFITESHEARLAAFTALADRLETDEVLYELTRRRDYGDEDTATQMPVTDEYAQLMDAEPEPGSWDELPPEPPLDEPVPQHVPAGGKSAAPVADEDAFDFLADVSEDDQPAAPVADTAPTDDDPFAAVFDEQAEAPAPDSADAQEPPARKAPAQPVADDADDEDDNVW